jgi:HAD superfamily hydrolase (TIGR01509 family)
LTANKNLSKQNNHNSATSVKTTVQNIKLKANGILIDLDGTILDVRKAYLEATKTAFAKVGKEAFDIVVVLEIPKRLEQDLPIDDLVRGIDAKTFLDAYLDAYHRATIEKAKPISNVSDTLRKLSEKAKLALSTKRKVPRKEVIAELEKFGLIKYFDYVVTAMDTKNSKPSPEGLMKCSELLGIQSCECIVVGDSVVDVRAGKNAGIRTVAVLSGIYSREELEREKPDLILESVNQLPDFIE